MTDLISTPASTEDESALTPAPRVEWTPAPPRKRRRWPLALWIGLPVLALAGAAAFFGTILIAPGVTIAGVPVGGLTVGAASEKVSQTISGTGVEVNIAGTTATITGADMGASIDADELAQAAIETNPLWQVGGWFPNPDRAAPTLDSSASEAALADAFATDWVDPVDAVVTFDAATSSYVVAPAVLGRGLDHTTIERAYEARLLDPSLPAAFDGELVDLEADITTEAATSRAEQLNAMVASVGFYVGEERTVPIAPEVLASWLTLTPDPDQGTIAISADRAAIQAVVDTLPAAVDRAATNGVQVVNKAGTVLRTEQAGADGRVLGATAGIAAAFASQLAGGDAAYALDVAVTPAQTTTIVRSLEVDLSDQRLYVKENDVVIDSWLISSGMPGWSTRQGNFTVNAKVRVQDMGNTEVGYLQPDVEWVMYFSGDQAFHAVYWRNIWGRPLSHGCVGMPTALAKQIYQWADAGTDVWVHA
ncbi:MULTISPECIES: L,D-transpeptidase [unclassified Microbacterium]|uniref:L,D-transpeptidase n=1 Tax=unclassified Microbacterium TaxID=2609290 RepID=UPI000C2BAD88|nr:MULTISPECIES: L,D-transpeptidase [unclassified Microbacterium]